MTSKEALRELDAAAKRLAADATKSRRKQLMWVRGELHRAYERGYIADNAVTSSEALFSAEPMAAYWDAAEAGELRLKQAKVRPSTIKSMQVRHASLRALAHEAGVRAELPPRPGTAPLRETVPPEQEAALLRFTGTYPAPSARTAQREVIIRLRALVGIIVDTGARLGEAAAIQLPDFAPDLAAVTLTRDPQGQQDGMPQLIETLPLSAPTRTALRAWLEVRSRIVGRLTGGAHEALWVSVRSGGVPGRVGPRLAGLPVHADALLKTYTSAVGCLNEERARHGLLLLPPCPEQLRRSWVRRTNPRDALRSAAAA